MIELLIFFVLPALSAGFCFLVKDFRIRYSVSLAVSVLHLFLTFSIFFGFFQPNLPYFFSMDALSQLFLLVLSNVYFWVVLVSYSFLKKDVPLKGKRIKKYYFPMLNFYLLANTTAILSNHFGMYWIALEATTLSVAPLIYYYRNDESLEAMWKYLFIVSLGIAFAFIGILFLTLSAKGTTLEGQQLFCSEFVKNAKILNPIWLKASFIFIFVGLSTKIGIAPMHSGDVDATSNAPSPIAALMSGSLRITGLIGVLRIFQIVSFSSSSEYARLMLIIGGVLSMIVAFVFMFKVKNYKRLLAYSSVEHLGIISLGIGIGGLAFVGAIYHVIYNSINKIVLFLAAGNLHLKFKTRRIDRISSVLNLLPWSGWILLLAFFAISGIPPFGIFFSELKIFEGILFSDKPWLLAIVLILLLFIFINMGKLIFQMLYRKDENIQGIDSQVQPGNPNNNIYEKFDISHFASIVLLIVLISIAVLSPQILQEKILSISRDFGISL
jgi:hydrogenase-4 component F